MVSVPYHNEIKIATKDEATLFFSSICKPYSSGSFTCGQYEVQIYLF